MKRRILITSAKEEEEEEDKEDEDEENEEDETSSLYPNLSESELDTSDEDLLQTSDENCEDETIEDQLSRVSLSESRIPIVAVFSLNCSQLFSPNYNLVYKNEHDIQLNLAHVDELDQKYPKLLSAKEMRIIKARLAVMRREVSILMLLGKSKDVHCRTDPTFCIGQTIANVTQVQYGYIDASNPRIKSAEIEKELIGSLDNNKHAVMIDSLEKLPGTQVMNLFQFIDKDETHKRRGMLLFVVYTGVDDRSNSRLSHLRDAEVAEKILLDRWSPSIPMDSLTSVISRICGSIVRVY